MSNLQSNKSAEDEVLKKTVKAVYKNLNIKHEYDKDFEFKADRLNIQRKQEEGTANNEFTIPTLWQTSKSPSRSKGKKLFIQTEAPQPLPKMCLYIHIPHNVWFEDQKIALVRQKADGIAGHLLVELVQIVKKVCSFAQNDAIFKVIGEVVLKTSCVDECASYLEKRFTELMEQRSLDQEDLETLPVDDCGSELQKNFNELRELTKKAPHEVQVESRPMKTAIPLFQSHFCPKCFVYNCMMHKNNTVLEKDQVYHRKKEATSTAARRRNLKQRIFSIEYALNEEKHHWVPCTHEGECTSECPCKVGLNYCEKYCNCSEECGNRYKGCRCGSKCSTTLCPCISSRRECDPAVCKCNVSVRSSFLYAGGPACCSNVSMQRGLKKPVEVKESNVAGWGCFAKSFIAKDEFIGEYTGEIISLKEADHRENLYFEKRCSYIFQLTKEYVIDATRKGNELRFVNHKKHGNCNTRMMNIGGDYRVAFYAAHDIEAGAELFFDYKYEEFQVQRFLKPTDRKILAKHTTTKN